MRLVWALFVGVLAVLLVGVVVSAVFHFPEATPFVAGAIPMFALGVVLAADYRGAARASAESLNGPRRRGAKYVTATPTTQRACGVVIAVFAVVMAVIATTRHT
jgi:ABC-type Fe3+-siderophore transport system permease subunit